MARRNKREPFNPFAPGASSKSQKKVLKQQPVISTKQSPNISRQEQMSAMRKKIKEQQERKKEVQQNELKKTQTLEEKKKVEAEKVEESKVEVPKVEVPKVEVPKVEVPKVEKKPSRLEDLKRRSDELAAKTGVVLPKSEPKPSTLFSKPKATAVPEKKKVVATRPHRKTKKGGGRQPKQHKLNRRKQLEFRFDARAILDNSSVAEEHRSNVFGQIWAKGERIGIDSAIEYISQKEQEGILTSDVSGELVALIKSYTTKR